MSVINFRTIRVFVPHFLIILPVLLWSACTSNSSEVALHDSLGSYIQAALSAQAEALTNWDQFILGTGKNCQQGLPVPNHFNLSQSQADQFPQALSVRDYLYTGITLLEQSSQVWDQICANSDAFVLPADVNRGYRAARDAKTALEQAQIVFSTWNP